MVQALIAAEEGRAAAESDCITLNDRSVAQDCVTLCCCALLLCALLYEGVCGSESAPWMAEALEM